MALSALLKRNGTWQCPTLTLLHMFGYGHDPAFRDDPRLKYLPASEKGDWDPAKSLQLNPGNENAVRLLRKLTAQ